MVRLRLLSTSSVVETAKLVVATTFRSAVNVKAEPESERLTEKVGRQTQELCKLLTEETKALGSSLIFEDGGESSSLRSDGCMLIRWRSSKPK
jgi:hypothetical protein